ncbi:pyridoxal-phosphate dependent enzyme [Nocardioides sp. zg-1308]|uniref:pyridoxal-phosphate dependent enzyme n=1 Tax=Nocardioides sp. zg-1308 TaxID=2736253 RepID=UPI0015548916|nr:pyridoxal-phosphate dependent enzyme [Nocardioides sp. zg-1308]NPD04836.1 pyridoxal-phosphate dependent enzyme [Nocardioides sp. zg-1308]
MALPPHRPTGPDTAALATLPTPLEPMPRLGVALGLGPDDLWVKRDDLIGLGGGGNKVRKLERTMAAALHDGADVVVTSGAPQSNHARLTAAAGARLGVPVVLVLVGDEPATETGNLLLDRLLGARIVWAGDVGAEGLAAAVQDAADHERSAGRRPGVIPFGGSNAVGARAYEDAGRELLDQAPDLRDVVVAVGSGGTMAGLVSALGPERVLGVDTGAVDDAEDRVLSLWGAIAPDGAAAGTLRIRSDHVGAGYEVLTDDTRAAMQLVARTEGIVLDPVYTGRAAAGLVASVRDGAVTAGSRTVLLHSGGLPGLFGHPHASPWREA